MPRRESMTVADVEAATKLKKIWLNKRKRLNLTQKKVAQRFGITQGLVSNYLNGQQSLNIKAVIMFATVLEEEPKDIYPELFTDLKLSATSQEGDEFLALYMQCPQTFRSLIKNIIIEYINANDGRRGL